MLHKVLRLLHVALITLALSGCALHAHDHAKEPQSEVEKKKKKGKKQKKPQGNKKKKETKEEQKKSPAVPPPPLSY